MRPDAESMRESEEFPRRKYGMKMKGLEDRSWT